MAWVWIGYLKLIPRLEEQVAGLDVDEQLTWVWVGSLMLVPGLEEQVVVEEFDEIAG